jgi:REP element-mobilizing transposase RayT
MSATRQLALELPIWGGARARAGRKSARARPARPHRKREEFRRDQPVHVTVRVTDHVWNLRSLRSFTVIDGALHDVRARPDFRVVHFTILGNHLHLIVEADGPRALATGMRALSIRLARRLNAMMGRRGRVLEDRYHAHVLRTPAEARNALAYVLSNYASHAARRGERVSSAWSDPYSSSAPREPRRAQGALWPEPATRAGETWLLRTAFRGASGGSAMTDSEAAPRVGEARPRVIGLPVGSRNPEAGSRKPDPELSEARPRVIGLPVREPGSPPPGARPRVIGLPV